MCDGISCFATGKSNPTSASGARGRNTPNASSDPQRETGKTMHTNSEFLKTAALALLTLAASASAQGQYFSSKLVTMRTTRFPHEVQTGRLARIPMLAILAMTLCFAQSGGSAGAAEQAPRRPNILWLIGENIGPDLGCYGAPLVKTPHLDRLAAEGMRFNKAFDTAPHCSCSRSAFMTGYGTAHWQFKFK